MKTNHMITDQNKSLIREFWNNFVSIYKIDIILAFILFIITILTIFRHKTIKSCIYAQNCIK